jgi:hypothetical protein
MWNNPYQPRCRFGTVSESAIGRGDDGPSIESADADADADADAGGRWAVG